MTTCWLRRAARPAAAALATSTAVGAVVRCHPTGFAVRTDDPTSAVVSAAAWLAWALLCYLLVAATVVALAALPGAAGTTIAALRPLAPRTVRRVVEAAAGTVVATAVGVAAVPASAAPPTPAPSRVTATSPLDWPGLAEPATRATPTATTAPASPVRLVVHRGDSLWTLSARLLGSRASATRVAATWPRLYAANRAVIGADPDLIRPGQRLVPPAPDERTP